MNGLKSVLTAILRFLARFLPEGVNEPLESMPSGSFIPPELEKRRGAAFASSQNPGCGSHSRCRRFHSTSRCIFAQTAFLPANPSVKAEKTAMKKELPKPAVFQQDPPDRRRERPLWRDFTIEGRIRRAYKEKFENNT